jgi:hypothetical protein
LGILAQAEASAYGARTVDFSRRQSAGLPRSAREVRPIQANAIEHVRGHRRRINDL